MVRSALAGCMILFVGLNFVLADTYKSKIKAVDEDKRTVTIEVDGKDKTFDLTKDAKIYSVGKAKKGQPAPETLIQLNAVKDKDATVTTEKIDNKEVVTAIKLETAKKKKKNT